MNIQKFENLIHRFFAEACLNIDIIDDKGRRTNPREWFVNPLSVIQKAIQLFQSNEILNYKYDTVNQCLVSYGKNNPRNLPT